MEEEERRKVSTKSFTVYIAFHTWKSIVSSGNKLAVPDRLHGSSSSRLLRLMENSAPSIDVGDELDAVVPEEGFGGVGRSLYESSADRGSFSDLLQMMNEARPDGEDVEPCREPSISKSSCGKRSNRSLGTWKDLVKAKKWKGKDSLLHKIKEKQKDRKVKKRKLKKKGLRTIDREQAAGLNKIEHYKRKDDKDGEYFHLFLLEVSMLRYFDNCQEVI